MCGIVGKISFNNKSVSKNELKKMADSIIHRGPDGQGYWINNNKNIGFGHRRLSILDLSFKGTQPMHYQNCTITYNGEIYNYLEIKSELIRKGYVFYSDTDTEVILASYKEYGKSCVKLFDGMFAFIIWDNEKQTFFGARDRFGEKPIFYFKDNNQFTFASEMKALFAIGTPKTPSMPMVFNYLAYDVVENPNDKTETFYKDIYQIPPSHSFTLKLDGKFKLSKYWEIDLTNKIEITKDQATKTFYTLFNEAIKKRMRSDVEIGTSLSGGLDSSSVLASIFNNSPNIKLNTFTARFNEIEYDEGYFIDILKNKYSFNSNYSWPKENLIIEDLDKVFHHQEEPFGSTSILAQWEVMKTAKEQNITVLLDGQGADEILAGYYKYFFAYLHETLKKNKTTFKEELIKIENNLSIKNLINNKFYMDNYFPKSKLFISNKTRHLRMTKIAPDLHKDFMNPFKKTPSPLTNNINLNEALYFDTFKYGLGKLLRFSDRNSMAFSREVRLPFLSHSLVEFVFSLPNDFKIFNGWSKKILRDSMDKVLPKEITWRKDKKGFQAPNAWLENEKVKDLINESQNFLKKENIISRPIKENSWKYIMCQKVFSKV